MPRPDPSALNNQPRIARAAAVELPVTGNIVWRWLTKPVGMNAAIAIFNAILIGILWNAVFGLVQTERQNTVRAAIDRNDNLAIAFEQYTERTIESADAVTQHLIREYVNGGGTVSREKFIADFTGDGKSIIGAVLTDEHGDAITTAYSGHAARSHKIAGART